MRLRQFGLHAGWVAGAVFAAALMLSAIATDGFDHTRDAVMLLGARGSSVSAVFNTFGLAAPGLLLMLFALALHRPFARNDLGFSARLCAQLMLIGALAFAALARFPFDAGDSDDPDSRRHVLAWTAATLAWLPAMLLFALAALRARRLHGVAALSLLLSGLMALLLGVPKETWPTAFGITAALLQRTVLAVFFIWPALSIGMLRSGRVSPRVHS
jgi:hypothetical membrane protein